MAGSALFALVVLAAFLWLPGRGLPRDLLASVPTTAIAVVSIRVERVLNSPAYDRLVVQRGQDKGIRRLQQLCGFHPLRGIEQALVFALPGASETAKPRIALLARGSIAHARLIQCVSKLGQGGMKGLVREPIEGFETLRSENGTTRAAFIGTDGVMAGDAEGVRLAIETLVGKRPGLDKDPVLAPLLRARADTHELALAARLAGNQALFARGVAALGLDPTQLSGAGLGALAADLALEPENVRVSAELSTDSDARARSLLEAAERVRARILAFPALALTGFAKPLRDLQLSSQGASVKLAASAQVRTLGALLELLPAVAAMRRGLDLSPAVPVGDAGTPPDPDADSDEDNVNAQP